MTTKYDELVEAEAARLEAESPDDENGEPEPEPEPEDEDEAADEEEAPPASMEKALKEFERENTRHEKALAKLMGDDFQAFEPCLACATVGFRPTVAMRFDGTLETCSACAGHGYLLTGAVREDRVVRECVDCQGNGYRAKPIEYAPPPVPAVPTARFDPYTGLPLDVPSVSPENGAPSGWAPGYQPQGTSAPAPTVGA